MSRREGFFEADSRKKEVDKIIKGLEYHEDWQPIVETLDHLALTLADEVDAERAIVTKLLTLCGSTGSTNVLVFTRS